MRTGLAMLPTLDLDSAILDGCRILAQRIAQDTASITSDKTTVSTERAVVRLFGIDGVDASGVPLPNRFVEAIGEGIKHGAAYWLTAGMMAMNCAAHEFVHTAIGGGVDMWDVCRLDVRKVREVSIARAKIALSAMVDKHQRRRDARDSYVIGDRPLLYVLTATGNIYEDVNHARAVAHHGGDIVAVIRSTAQSLLDYVPYGPTTEGFGGTFATQENFRIMRSALDEWGRENGRYVRLSSFCSGLCMPEIAVIGAIEGLDNMVNDALYGILYRDINMMRTLIDQSFSRRINGYFGITINTGEDNYLRTADAVDAAPSVLASQLINFELAKASGVRECHIGIGNAFEIHPDVEDGFLFEVAQAALTRQLFPTCPVKYMPPTKHMNGDIFRTHANNVLFSLASILTRQSIQTIGVPTEGVFTPHIHDRMLGLECARYVHHFAGAIGHELRFVPDGKVQARAREVTTKARDILEVIADRGLPSAIGDRIFGNVARRIEEGRGLDGVINKSPQYLNPFDEAMRSETNG